MYIYRRGTKTWCTRKHVKATAMSSFLQRGDVAAVHHNGVVRWPKKGWSEGGSFFRSIAHNFCEPTLTALGPCCSMIWNLLCTPVTLFFFATQFGSLCEVSSWCIRKHVKATVMFSFLQRGDVAAVHHPHFSLSCAVQLLLCLKTCLSFSWHHCWLWCGRQGRNGPRLWTANLRCWPPWELLQTRCCYWKTPTSKWNCMMFSATIPWATPRMSANLTLSLSP